MVIGAELGGGAEHQARKTRIDTADAHKPRAGRPRTRWLRMGGLILII